MDIVLAGCGALGSQIAMHLVGDHTLHLIDNDRVGEENIGTSAYSRVHIGMTKVQTLAEMLYLKNSRRTNPIFVRVERNIRWYLPAQDGEPLVVDTFDNPAARGFTQSPLRSTIHIGVSVDRVGLIAWNNRYPMPQEEVENNPVCTHLLGARILRLTAAAATNAIERFIETGQQSELIITEKEAHETYIGPQPSHR